VKKSDEVYDKVTAALVSAIESGDIGKWRAPWHGVHSGLPFNATTRQAYRGGNVVSLWIAELEHDYPTSEWATYNQWQSIGAQVRKDEHGTGIIKYLPLDAKHDADGELLFKRSLVVKGYTVFNAAQVDGYEQPEREPVIGIGHADAFFARHQVQLRFGEPAYNPRTDIVSLPRLQDFDTPEAYYATKAHEHVHWTGAKGRCERDGIAKFDHFGSEQYAFEELVAEIGSAFVCALLGIDAEPRPDHAQYLHNWLSVLRHDPKALYRAASQAQKAVDFLLDGPGCASQSRPADGWPKAEVSA